MDFHNEYIILSQHPSSHVLEIRFHFNGQNIRLFFTKSEKHQFLVLICELDTATVIKNIPFYEFNLRMHINGYWDNGYEYVKEYLLDKDYKMTTFYNYLRGAIQMIAKQTSSSKEQTDFKIYHYTLSEGLNLLQNLKEKSTTPHETIYFNHVRRRNISDNQYAKVKLLLGKDAANYLASLNLTAVFTSDIRKQRKLVLEEST
ncbi:hypothetical protein [Listeria innocua]|uniref:hypothetical protein n=1 Tax=Listeria innocua TaxID=1642 RepID=UPI001623B172|nr:hypothetical protein [Listeria innocua]MBC1385630.1 hypothetical protein [Listeria innocua]